MPRRYGRSPTRRTSPGSAPTPGLARCPRTWRQTSGAGSRSTCWPTRPARSGRSACATRASAAPTSSCWPSPRRRDVGHHRRRAQPRRAAAGEGGAVPRSWRGPAGPLERRRAVLAAWFRHPRAARACPRRGDDRHELHRTATAPGRGRAVGAPTAHRQRVCRGGTPARAGPRARVCPLRRVARAARAPGRHRGARRRQPARRGHRRRPPRAAHRGGHRLGPRPSRGVRPTSRSLGTHDPRPGDRHEQPVRPVGPGQPAHRGAGARRRRLV